MEYLTTTILSGMTYDLIRNGLQISTMTLKEKLKNWLISDSEVEILVKQINDIDQLEDLNELAICRNLDKNPTIQELIINIPQDNSNNKVTQNHSGRGDNIAGNKVINQNNY